MWLLLKLSTTIKTVYVNCGLIRKYCKYYVQAISRIQRPLRPASVFFMRQASQFFLFFSFLHHSFYFFGSVWQFKLATRQLLGARKYSLSYRIISCRIASEQTDGRLRTQVP